MKRVEELRSQGIIPKIATIRVGDDPGDIAYEHGICSRAEEMGIDIKQKVFAGDISQERLLAKIAAYNEDQDIHGVLIFRPLPKQFDDKTICKALDFRKDVDGITTGSMAGVFTGSGEGFPPCTAEACIRMLDYYGSVSYTHLDVYKRQAFRIVNSQIVKKSLWIWIFRCV